MSTITPSSSIPWAPLPQATRIGAVRLTVRDLDRVRGFYEHALGLQAVETAGGAIALQSGPGTTLVELYGDSAAELRDPRAPGLYHLAILHPTRRDLALALARLIELRWPLQGASDHLVSEALYLADPEGNGIEIYRDRPREQWTHRNGQLEMATLPLDVDSLLGALSARDEEGLRGLPAAATVGHVHLQVAELRETEAFYHQVLGFDVTVRLPSALFVSAGGYHHHLGMNTWHSAGAAPPATARTGLRSFDIVLPSELELQRVLERVQLANLPVSAHSRGWLVRDPSGNGVVLLTA